MRSLWNNALLLLAASTFLAPAISHSQTFGPKFPSEIVTAVSTVDVNKVARDLDTYCSNDDSRSHQRANKLVQLGFYPVEPYEVFDETVFFLRHEPPLLVGLTEAKGFEQKSQIEVWLTQCGITAGGTLSEVGYRNALASFELDPNRWQTRRPVDFNVPHCAKGWLIPPNSSEDFAVAGFACDRDGKEFSTIAITVKTVAN